MHLPYILNDFTGYCDSFWLHSALLLPWPAMDACVKLFFMAAAIGLSVACLLNKRTSRTGVRCVIKNNSYGTSQGYHQCIKDCLRKDCPFVNYNEVKKSCELSQQDCSSLILDDRYNLTAFSPLAALCLEWVPAMESDTANLIPVSQCHEDAIFDVCYVGRLISGSHTLPGKYNGVDYSLWSSFNGQPYGGGVKEVLTVNTNCCQVAWIPYTAGNVIPIRAVVGGFLTTGSAAKLYVIRGQAVSLTLIGYYDPNTELGYLEYHGVHESTEMEMLVVV